jgi:hypothetical protein
MTESRDAAGPPLSLFFGRVVHSRLRPVAHRFGYSVAAILVDLDRLEEAGRLSPFFSVNRANVVAFHEKDHGRRDGGCLRAHVDRLLETNGLPRADRVELLCYPTFLGYTFNPISIYFCRKANGEPIAALCEVHNTFGDSTTYVLAGKGTPLPHTALGGVRAKRMYVSPFMEMDTQYHFTIRQPARQVAIAIRQTDNEGTLFRASFHGSRMPVNAATLSRLALQTGGFAWKVLIAIHFEALRLWLKGMRVRPRRALIE